jgi:uncharacterized protein YgiM (DUF1202 family)
MKNIGFGAALAALVLTACAHGSAPEAVSEQVTMKDAEEMSIRQEKLAILGHASDVKNAKAEHVAVLPGHRTAKVAVAEKQAPVKTLRLPSYDQPMPPTFEMTKKAPALRPHHGPALNPNFERAATQTHSGTYYVNVEALNVRTGPSMDQPVARIVRIGDQVQILSESRGWAQIGDNEFVARKFLDPESTGKQGTINVKSEKEQDNAPVAPTIDI